MSGWIWRRSFAVQRAPCPAAMPAATHGPILAWEVSVIGGLAAKPTILPRHQRIADRQLRAALRRAPCGNMPSTRGTLSAFNEGVCDWRSVPCWFASIYCVEHPDMGDDFHGGFQGGFAVRPGMPLADPLAAVRHRRGTARPLLFHFVLPSGAASGHRAASGSPEAIWVGSFDPRLRGWGEQTGSRSAEAPLSVFVTNSTSVSVFADR